MEVNTTKEKLRDLILDEDLEKLELKMKEPNIFYILKSQTSEIKHSNVLAWLLNPNENHGLNDIFIKKFLKDIFSSSKLDWIDEFDVDGLDFSDISVFREFENIDILIVTNEFVLCVENKVLSSEHSDQLSRYQNIVLNKFPNKKHVFVYLTLYGDLPEKEEDQEIYITYSYETILKNIERIVNIYKKSFSENIYTYLLDYTTVLRREIMKNDETNRLAIKIYKTHKDAIDFIKDNIPDFRSRWVEIFARELKNNGFNPGSKGMTRIRFLTKKLENIPHNGTGWPEKEAFSFEFSFTTKKITLKTVISPGEPITRKKINEAISKLDSSQKPQGEKWLVHYIKKWDHNLSDDYFEEDEIVTKFNSILPDAMIIIEEVENVLSDLDLNNI